MADFNVTIKRHNGSTWDLIYPKTIAENVISGVLADARIPGLAASKITSGVFADARIPSLDASKITTGTLGVDRIPSLDTAKITSGTFDATRIPGLDTAKITSGVFADDRIPSLAASKINSGVFADARIPSLAASKITSGTFDAARIPGLDAGKITSGTFDVARLPAIALTNVVTDTTMTNFLVSYTGIEIQEGDVLILTTDKKTYIHNGGTTGTAADFTLLETPTDLVTSVAGKTGVVTLVKGDVGLDNVPNVDATNPANITQNSTHRFVTDTEKSTWNAKVAANAAITAGTKTKITYDSKGLVTAGADLVATDIPNLDADKITTGTFAAARIPSLSPSKITQDANNRFVTDTEKNTWNAKQDKLTLNSGQVLGRTSTGSGSPEAVDTIDISQINLQSKVILIQDSLLSGYSASSGDIAFTY